MKFFNSLVIIGLIALVIAGCNKNDDSNNQSTSLPYEDLTFIGETYAIGAATKVVVYANEELFVGHNVISVVLFDSASGVQLTEGHVTLEPIMHMNSGMMHACPTTQPSTFDDDKSTKGAVMFVMPSGMMGTWDLQIGVHNHSSMSNGTAVLTGLEVSERDDARVLSQTSSIDSTTYFVTLIDSPWKVGMNNFELQVSKRSSMMDWPYVEDVEVRINPTMPDMGHGSPNNGNPDYTALGYYEGLVNFTMTGFWRVDVSLIDGNGDTLVTKLPFEIRF